MTITPPTGDTPPTDEDPNGPYCECTAMRNLIEGQLKPAWSELDRLRAENTSLADRLAALGETGGTDER
jgi:hypothetical protein